MMLQWFEENPKDGARIARAIKVGIPLKANHKALKEDVSWGYPVPEADREIKQETTTEKKDKAFHSIIEDPRFIFDADTSQSCPTRLPLALVKESYRRNSKADGFVFYTPI